MPCGRSCSGETRKPHVKERQKMENYGGKGSLPARDSENENEGAYIYPRRGSVESCRLDKRHSAPLFWLKGSDINI